jgi:hypothetical protein
MTYTPILNILEVAAAVDQKEVPINNGFVRLEDATQATASITITGTARTLTTDEFTTAYSFRVANSVTATATLQVPATERAFAVDNRQNATYGVVLKHPGTAGATVTIPPGVIGQLITDGTNIATPANISGVSGVASVNSRTGTVTLGPTDLRAVTAKRLIGNSGTASGASEEIALGNGFALNSGTVNIQSAVTISGTAGGTVTIAPGSGTRDVIVNLPAGGTLTFAGAPAYPRQTVMVDLVQGATPAIVNFPTSAFEYGTSGGPTGFVATAVANKIDRILFMTPDGTIWAFMAVNQGFSV